MEEELVGVELEPVVEVKKEGIRKKKEGSNSVCVDNKNKGVGSISNGCLSQNS